ncbi:MAG: sigma-70 family RNA polymerase sigma factor [Pirellulaceae bacterium]|nr:sigma-70 family RNA polymerase sigma factor [Pirellulaceae bacterium]
MNSDDINPEGMSPTDRSLVVMVRDGDTEAATILYERYARRVFGLVKSKLGDQLATATEPEDLVQSIFRSVFRGVQSGHYDAPPGTTLWNLMAVIAINKLRNSATHHAAQCRDINRRVSLDGSDEGQSTMIDHASIEFFEVCFRETLELLRPLDREILLLRVQGNSVDEISAATRRSCRTIERRLQKSREKLASLLLDGE